MNKDWTTKYQDIYMAQHIMDNYASQQNCESLSLFELVVNRNEKRMNFQISSWVFTLALYFKSLYGDNQGDFVTRRVISHCLTQGNTLH